STSRVKSVTCGVAAVGMTSSSLRWVEVTGPRPARPRACGAVEPAPEGEARRVVAADAPTPAWSNPVLLRDKNRGGMARRLATAGEDDRRRTPSRAAPRLETKNAARAGPGGVDSVILHPRRARVNPPASHRIGRPMRSQRTSRIHGNACGAVRSYE